MNAGPEYETYKTLANRLRVNRVDNLVCMACGVLVVSKKDHDRLHSIMSSWAWAIAILKANHASEEIHDKWDIVPRIDSRRFGNNNADELSVLEENSKQENTNPAGAKKSPDRYEIAWRIWCWVQAYFQKEDREVITNWMLFSDEHLTDKDIMERDAALEIADLAVRMAKGENHG